MEVYAPKIEAVALSPPLLPINQSVMVTVQVAEHTVTVHVVERYAGEIIAGEVNDL